MDLCMSPRTPNMTTTPRGSSQVGFPSSPRVPTPRPQMASTPRRSSPPSLANVGITSISPHPPQDYRTTESGPNIYARRRSQPLVVAVANTECRVSKPNGVGTPHEPSSPEGKLLIKLLQEEWHFFEFAVAEHLDELASANARDAASASKNQKPDTMESLLQRRIAEVKEKECQTAVEDIMYMSIVHKFTEVEVSMVPKLSDCISNNTLEIWSSKCRELESIHSLEFQELTKEHVINIMRMRGKFNASDRETSTKIDKLHIGRIYSSSIMYGYFLKSACFRRQLDSSIAHTPATRQPVSLGVCSSATEFENVATYGQSTTAQIKLLCQDFTRPETLGSYVKGLDSESLQRCAKLKSKEAVNVIEKHTWGIFGDEKISANNINVTFASLERLVLEAVAFGSFLWDVERSVDSVYGLKKNL